MSSDKLEKLEFSKIAVFGAGLLGGSICRDLRNYSKDIELHVYSRNPESLKSAVDEGIADFIGDVKNPDLSIVDLIIVCLPVIASVSLINNLLNNSGLRDGTLMIDVGSVKEEIIIEVEKNKSARQFIGCHPMAGSEKDGYGNSREGLFKNASVIITPNKFNRKQDIDKVIKFWKVLNARTIICPAGLHDLIISLTSHLPHLLSCLIVENFFETSRQETINKIIGEKSDLFIGQGFRDVTRIAAGSPDIWADISVLNKTNILKSIDLIIDKLRSLKDILNSENNIHAEIRSFFKKIREYKQTIDRE
ncbi:MAG: prephenate dehydrogenase/arogenate dehydrogenase family protein [Spirochaetes bacterium]|nr:prephenate dehydrogenase/arogenate dehydrogenase family protein [Spirochaetota bacterium]